MADIIRADKYFSIWIFIYRQDPFHWWQWHPSCRYAESNHNRRNTTGHRRQLVFELFNRQKIVCWNFRNAFADCRCSFHLQSFESWLHVRVLFSRCHSNLVQGFKEYHFRLFDCASQRIPLRKELDRNNTWRRRKTTRLAVVNGIRIPNGMVTIKASIYLYSPHSPQIVERLRRNHRWIVAVAVRFGFLASQKRIFVNKGGRRIPSSQRIRPGGQVDAHFLINILSNQSPFVTFWLIYVTEFSTITQLLHEFFQYNHSYLHILILLCWL